MFAYQLAQFSQGCAATRDSAPSWPRRPTRPGAPPRHPLCRSPGDLSRRPRPGNVYAHQPIRRADQLDSNAGGHLAENRRHAAARGTVLKLDAEAPQ